MTEENNEILNFDIMQIMDMLPHRYPFLLVDRITECVSGKYSVGYKNLTMNEAFFQGHFPGNPILPGVLQIEAMAQCAAPIFMTSEQYRSKLALFAGVNNAKFKGVVRPGDRLEMRVEFIKSKGPFIFCHGTGSVDNKKVVEADLMLALTDNK